MTGKEYLIRGGRVITMMGSGHGTTEADVHVRDGEIIAIGPDLSVRGAEVVDARDMIVLPGLVDTHLHLWNTVLRNMEPPGLGYFAVKKAFVEHFTPQDVYRSNRLTLLEAINAGITTVNNFAHNVRSPAHADAELRAMAESGIRGRYSYGWRDPTPRDQAQDLQDILRAKREWFSAGSAFQGRVHLGMAVRGPRYTEDAVVAQEFRFAAQQGLPISIHTGATARPGEFVSVAKLCAAGYIDRTTLLVHWIGQTDADTEAALKTGASISLSPTSDLCTPRDGSFHDALLMLRGKRINLCLSIDSALLGGVSMFEQMATTWYVGVPSYDSPTDQYQPIDVYAVLEMATVSGARALGLEDQIGTLEVGKRADIILVRTTDLNMAPLGRAHAAIARVATPANVDTVMIDGRILKRDGKLVGCDVRGVVKDAEATLLELRQRAGGSWAEDA